MKPQNKLYTGRELIAHAVAVDEFQGFKYIKSDLLLDLCVLWSCSWLHCLESVWDGRFE